MISHCLGRYANCVLMMAAAAAYGCGAEPRPAPQSHRLVDDFTPALVHQADAVPATPEPPSAALWRFDEPASGDGSETHRWGGWKPLSGISGLSVVDGRLSGETTSDTPVLRLVREAPFATRDLLHEVRVRMRVSAGKNVAVHFIGPEAGDIDRARLAGAPVPWLIVSPLIAGPEESTFSITPTAPVRGTEIQQILLRLSDQAGASFSIESVRLVFRREHLASIASGIGWHGLSEIYRETVVSRAPESIRWSLVLPQNPRLSLSLGTLDDHPVTFQVSLETQSKGGAPEVRPLVRRTLTTPYRWQDVDLDLDPVAQRGPGGDRVNLVLSLDAASAGTLGLWGSPVVRRRVVSAATGDGARPGVGHPRAVVFVLCDTLRPDRLGIYGHKRATAPTLARLAEEGTLFRDAVAQASWTKVSAPSLLTSLYPTSSGVRDFPDRLPSSVTTLAEVYRQAGYATLGFSSVPFTGKFSNLHQGYEELHERRFDPSTSSKTARLFVDVLLPWMERHREVPFFVFLHIFDPHSPFQPEAPYDTLWADAAWHAEHREQGETLRRHIQDPLLQLGAMGSREEFLAAGLDPGRYIARELDWYDGSIRGMDAELGRVLERLRELGLEQETLLIFASDHGEEFLEHGRMFHGQSVYGELTQVPWLLHYPGVVPAGTVVAETVQLLDLMPTVLELSALETPAAAQGQSAVSLMLAQAGADLEASGAGAWRSRPAISEKPRSQHQVVPPPRQLESFALVHDGWKLVRHIREDGEEVEHELFDHRQDPLNTTDVAAGHPEVVERLSRLLDAWHETAKAQRVLSDAETTEGLDPEELKRLRALGYLQ